MADATVVYGLVPREPGASPVPTGGKEMIFGTSTLSGGTKEVSVPFGGSSVDVAVGIPSSGTSSTNTQVVIVSDGTITSGAVTFASLGTTATTTSFQYIIIGDMNEA